MYITTVPNRGSPPAILLRETYRDGGKAKNRTLANLTKWTPEKIAALRAVLRDETLAPAGDGFEILRALPHGHVAAVLGIARRLGLDPRVKSADLIPSGPARTRRLVLAMIVARLIDPAAKLATARALDEATSSTSLGALLGLGTVAVNELYQTLDWLLAEQPRIEAKLARRHLAEGTLVLYDVTSTYLEGRCCPLAHFGHSRDDKANKRQIVFGVLCTATGCPVAVEVFPGNIGDPSTLKTQIAKLQQRFRLRRVIVVGDRGLITEARITEELEPAGLDWITALRAPAIKALAEDDGPLQLSLFDQRDLAEITSPDYPGERLVVCRNTALAAERARKRGELLDATERALRVIHARVRRTRKPLRGAAAIGEAVGAVINRRKMAQHFRRTITDTDLTVARDQAAIDAEAEPDGIDVLRTRVPQNELDAAATVRSYRALANVECAFRSCKTVDLEVRPVFRWSEDRVCGRVFLCLLAYHLEWHMRSQRAIGTARSAVKKGSRPYALAARVRGRRSALVEPDKFVTVNFHLLPGEPVGRFLLKERGEDFVVSPPTRRSLPRAHYSAGICRSTARSSARRGGGRSAPPTRRHAARRRRDRRRSVAPVCSGSGRRRRAAAPSAAG